MTRKSKILFFLLTAMLLGLGVAGLFLYAVYGNNTNVPEGEKIITINEGSTYEDVKKILAESKILKNEMSFDLIAKLMKYKDNSVKDGKYLVRDGWNNRDLIGILRLGKQIPIDVTFNNVRTVHNLAGKIAPYFSSDSSQIIDYVTSPSTLEELGLKNETILSIFIPNTYQMYWNTKPEGIVARAKKEHNKFWNENKRKEKAKELEMTKEEVYTLASIVEKESNLKSERKRIAGVYLNRLKKGIALHADPTVVFATGQYDLRRVLNKHLEFDSPYNTYKYAGLPPGPIYMPSVNSIDAVLDAEKHDYLYFCAKPGYDSEHVFAKTLRQHNVNANVYRRWLSSEGIR